MNHDELNDAILVGIIQTLKIMKDVRSEGDDLNDIDFDQVIEHRCRDLVDPSFLEYFIEISHENLKEI